jgi:hypothetical protein
VIDPNAQTMAAQLKHHSGQSYAKIPNFLSDYFQMKTVASTFVVHVDETGWRIGLDSAWLWAFGSPQITIYQFGGGRGYDVPLELLGEHFRGILAR